jgi:riboflavin synthase
MFTGIVEELGRVIALEHHGDSAVLHVESHVVGADALHGASIAVDGVCLTVVGAAPLADGGRQLNFDVMAETLKRSVIGTLKAGDPVNLERSVRVDGRLDGHIVQGHVDGTGVLLARHPGDAWDLVRFGMPGDLARYVAEKGSIAVDGVSLTVTAVGDDATGGYAGGETPRGCSFEVGLIPETLRATTLGSKQVGDPVNLEVDVLAKYTERLLASRGTR